MNTRSEDVLHSGSGSPLSGRRCMHVFTHAGLWEDYESKPMAGAAGQYLLIQECVKPPLNR